MRGLMGSFAVLPLPDLVELLARRRLAGSLTCERGTVRKSVQLRDGKLVGAASNDPREYLGQLLIDFGHIDEEQLTKAFQVQEATKVRIGKVLTLVGAVTPATVREVLAIKIRETILDAFLWDAGLFYFDETPPPPSDELDAEVPLADVAREAEFRATAWSAFRAAFPSGAATLDVNEAHVPASATPDTVDGRLLALAREGKTVDELGVALHATDFHLYQRLYALHRQGALRPALVGAGEDADEPGATTRLLERARALLADGQARDAEAIAAHAVEVAPAHDGARAVLAEAERALARALEAELLDRPRSPRLRVERDRLGSLPLATADRYLLSRCDGRRTIRDLVALAPIRELDVLRALRRLADAELVELG